MIIQTSYKVYRQEEAEAKPAGDDGRPEWQQEETASYAVS